MILLVGPSGAGKTRIYKELADMGYKTIPSYGTRPRRESDGDEFITISEEAFLLLKERNYFAETACYNGYYYGTAAKDIVQGAIKIVEPQGLEQLKEQFENLVTVYVKLDEEIRYNRMRERGDSVERISSRLTEDKVAFAGLETQSDIVFDNSEEFSHYRVTRLTEAIDTVYFLKQHHRSSFSIHV